MGSSWTLLNSIIMDKLNKLQKEYLCLLRLDPLGGKERANFYSLEGIPLERIDGEIKRLEEEIPRLKEALSAKGVVVKDLCDV